MSKMSPQIVVCGAGMAGISAAYHLTVKHKKRVLIIDEGQPLSLTSNKGTQAYRNWWPGPDDTMVKFINRSIELIAELAEKTNNHFGLNQRGYLFLTAQESQINNWRKSSQEISKLGAGEFREHSSLDNYLPTLTENFNKTLLGADLILDPEYINKLYPFLTKDVKAALHIRRAGWMNSIKLGEWLKEEVERCGGEFLLDKLESIKVINNKIVSIKLASGKVLEPESLVLAVGPHLKSVGDMLGLDLPVFNELHSKITFPDTKNIFSANAPLMIWDDELYLPWTDEEKRLWASNVSTSWLLNKFPSGVHLRPKGDSKNLEIMIIWTYKQQIEKDFKPIKFNSHYGEVLIRAISRMIPEMSHYFAQGDKAYIDGGYYCKTSENRPLIGHLPISGVYIIGALSGYGIMSSQAAGELLALHVLGEKLPDYAPMFLLERYQNASYQKLLKELQSNSGQL
ncbi:MAG: FAD-binding oxidoreductase [Blastocatellia bacterium]|nr:FAD-binding oxidoreductase [Blastocatellia bacterium]